MADENTVITAANTIFMTVPGIKRAFLYARNKAPLADLPCVIPIGTTLTHGRVARDRQVKDYAIKFLLLVTIYDKPLESMDMEARPYGDAVVDTFFTYPNLGLSSEILELAEMTVGDYGVIRYNDVQDYLGWTFNLTARIKTVLSGGDLT